MAEIISGVRGIRQSQSQALSQTLDMFGRYCRCNCNVQLELMSVVSIIIESGVAKKRGAAVVAAFTFFDQTFFVLPLLLMMLIWPAVRHAYLFFLCALTRWSLPASREVPYLGACVASMLSVTRVEQREPLLSLM